MSFLKHAKVLILKSPNDMSIQSFLNECEKRLFEAKSYSSFMEMYSSRTTNERSA